MSFFCKHRLVECSVLQFKEPANSMQEEALYFHPAPDENGDPVPVFSPIVGSAPEAWLKSDDAATWSVTHPGILPERLNGIPFTHEKLGEADWRALMKRYRKFPEPEEPESPKRRTSGLVIRESDGRIWLAHPTNQFGGRRGHLPEGTARAGALARCQCREGRLGRERHRGRTPVLPLRH